MNEFKKWMVGFRKLTFGLLFFVVSLILLLYGQINGAEWIKYNSGVVTAFFATNVGEHIINIGKDWIKSKLNKQNMDIIKELK